MGLAIHGLEQPGSEVRTAGPAHPWGVARAYNPGYKAIIHVQRKGQLAVMRLTWLPLNSVLFSMRKPDSPDRDTSAPTTESSSPAPLDGVEGDLAAARAHTAALIEVPNGIGSLHVFLNGTAGTAGWTRCAGGTDFETPAFSFVVLSQSGRGSYVFKAGLFDRNGVLISRQALKVQRFDPGAPGPPPAPAKPGEPAARAGSPRSAQTNVENDAIWRQRVEAEQHYSASSSAVPKHISLGDLTDGDHHRVGPRLFCKHRQLFFRPRCPQSFAPLVDCRDDELLRSYGLPAYSQSSVRFLYSSTADPQTAPRFYTDAEDLSEEYKDLVGCADDCFRDQGCIVRVREELKAKDPALHEELCREFPCYQCPEAGRCYPEGEGYARVLDRLVAFSFHDFHAICTELFDLQFDDYCDAVGGRPIDPWIAELRAAPSGSPNRYLMEQLERLRSAPRLLRFDEVSNRGALEILFLKWSLLTRTVDRLRALYRECQRPHLHLSARHVVVRAPGSSRFTPLLWDIEVGLIGLDGALPFVAGGPAERAATGCAGVPVVPAHRDLPVQTGHDQTTGGQTASATPTRLPSGSLLARLQPPPAPEPHYASSALMRRNVETSKRQNAESNDFDSSTFGQLPHYGLVDDLYAVGVLLLRAILVNSRQGLSVVTAEANRALNEIRTPASDVGARQVVPLQRLERWIEAASRTPAWHQQNVYYQPVDHDWVKPTDCNRPPAGSSGFAGESLIPPNAWHHMLGIGIRLLAGYAPLGFVPRDADPGTEERVLDDLVDSFLAVERDLEGELFSSDQGGPAMLDVVSTALHELANETPKSRKVEKSK